MDLKNSINIPKKTTLQQAGELNTKVYYVHKGLLRSYYLDEKGKEHTFMFAPEGWYIGDSCPPETSCELFIESLENAEVSVLDKNDALNNHPKNALVVRIQKLQQRILMMMSATLYERYLYFIKLYPKLEQRIPQRLIASFLGGTPEALSAVKSQMKGH